MKGIYLLINRENNKVYVGSTGSFKKRFYSHFYLLKNNTHYNQYLQYAYNKHGLSKFFTIKLEECKKDVLLIREKYWIEFFNACDSSYGYNVTKDPISPNCKKVLQINPKTGAIINTYKSAQEASNSVNGTYNKLIEICGGTGRSNTYKGFIWIYEEDFTQENLNARLQKINKPNPRAKMIYQLDKTTAEIINTYTANQLKELYGKSKLKSIRECCRGYTNSNKRKLTWNNFVWCYKENYKTRKLNILNNNWQRTSTYISKAN